MNTAISSEKTTGLLEGNRMPSHCRVVARGKLVYSRESQSILTGRARRQEDA